MSNCHVSNEIAIHCNSEPTTICFGCDENISEDDNATEVLTRDSGYQFVCDDCVEDYIVGEV